MRVVLIIVGFYVESAVIRSSMVIATFYSGAHVRRVASLSGCHCVVRAANNGAARISKKGLVYPRGKSMSLHSDGGGRGNKGRGKARPESGSHFGATLVTSTYSLDIG